ncbi:cell division protein FtsZ [Neorickettsia sp. 179522]|uniref:cell division protein FtsZ n=1 Tax=Neorickettsia sp. 179522 TaxID=1714371 RepID=UPI00079B7B5E|nr:cell division protein FtsZ [Neorickettsia sp. 179522]KYH12445.1 cell division protein FtsZ [Neorickettsia sp. 179522]
MTLRLSVPLEQNQHQSLLCPKIAVIGVGGAGGNAINNMINSGLRGVKFIAANTDAQALEHSLADVKIQLGANLTKGLGAGSIPEIGRQAAEESINELAEAIEDADMLFITAGMGGGTGTGAATVIARMAMERKVLVVAVVTKPFYFEGARRAKVAEVGLEALRRVVDTYIVINNQNLFRIANEKTTFADAFKEVDKILYFHVREISSLMVNPGYINLDFADVRSVMSKMGKALMGTSEASGENRAVKAAENSIANPLLDNLSVQDAKGILINITGGPDMTLFEVDAAANCVREKANENVNIIFGSTCSESMSNVVRVSVVATGISPDHGELSEAGDLGEEGFSGWREEKSDEQKKMELLEIPAFIRRVKKKS